MRWWCLISVIGAVGCSSNPILSDTTADLSGVDLSSVHLESVDLSARPDLSLTPADLSALADLSANVNDLSASPTDFSAPSDFSPSVSDLNELSFSHTCFDGGASCGSGLSCLPLASAAPGGGCETDHFGSACTLPCNIDSDCTSIAPPSSNCQVVCSSDTLDCPGANTCMARCVL